MTRQLGALFFDLLLQAYPPRLRRELRDDARATFFDRCAGARRHGLTRLLGLLMRETVDSVRTGTRARRGTDDILHGPRPPRDDRSLRERLGNAMDTLLQDFRYALRSLAKSPGFSLTAMVVLAIGIGANAALFSAVDAVLLRPLPFADPDRLLMIWETNPERGWTQAQVASANYLDWRERNRTFTDIAAYNEWLDEGTLLVDGEPEVLLVNEVTGSFFELLGVAPVLGEGFRNDDDWAVGEPKVVLAYPTWQQRFGGDPGILGRRLSLDGVAHTVVGVGPRGLAFPQENVEAWKPVRWDPERRTAVSFRRAHGMRAIGRLAPGQDAASAVADLERIASELEAEYPETNTEMGVGAGSLHDFTVGESRTPLLVLFAAVGLVLLVASANVANMQLVRAAGRQQELAVRRALGADRARLLRQRLAETLTLTTAGGAAGLLVGYWVLRLLAAARPAVGGGLFPRLDQAGLDLRVGAFTLVAVALTALVFAAIPTIAGTRRNVAAQLGSGTRASIGRRHRRAATALIVAEVALVVPLVIGAGLMVRTLSAVSSTDPGFEPAGLTAFEISFPRSRYDTSAAIAGFITHSLDVLRERPGVDSAAFASRLPFVAQRWSSDFRIESWEPDRYGVGVRHDEVSTGFFATSGVPLVAGRDFERSDATTEAVAIVNRSLVDQFLPGTDAVGERLCFERVAEDCRYWFRIVGVADDVARVRLSEREEPSIYALALQDTPGGGYLHVRSDLPAAEVAATVRSVIRELDPVMPVEAVRQMEFVVQASMARERLFLQMLGAFAVVAMMLAALGIYGVVSYATARRVPEIGVRITLGATARHVARGVLISGLSPVLAGGVLGMLISVGAGRLLRGLLVGVAPVDPATYLVTLMLVAAVAAAACWLPMRRATRVDPVEALRSDQ